LQFAWPTAAAVHFVDALVFGAAFVALALLGLGAFGIKINRVFPARALEESGFGFAP